MPKKRISETFTSDLRHNYTVVSLDALRDDIEEHKVESSNLYTEEELQLVWDTLREIYEIYDEHYIIMYLMYYLGMSFRKAANILERGPSFVFLYANTAIQAVKDKLQVQNDCKIEDDFEERESEELP